jgi:inner membrane protein involved in colicin E2 resistance
MIMVLLIPVGMIKDVINDRQMVSHQAERDISQSWGGQQFVSTVAIQRQNQVDVK